MKTFNAFIIVSFFCCALAVSAERKLTDTKGREIAARILSADDKVVRFVRLSDGQRFEIPLETLIEADRAFVLEWRKSAKIAAEKSENSSKSDENLLASIKPGVTVDYADLAFEPSRWKERGLETRMDSWVGNEVAFLALPSDLDPVVMVHYVNALDRGWRLYREITGKSPRLNKEFKRKPVIAAIPSPELTCGVGCGQIGSTGIELAMFYDRNYPALVKDPMAIHHYTFYEMGRNYYTFEDRHSLFFTGFAVLMRYVCMDTLGYHDEDPRTRVAIEEAERHFKDCEFGFLDIFTDLGPSRLTGNRIKDDSGNLINPSDIPCVYASAMLRLRRENGGNEWLSGFFRELEDTPPVKPDSPDAALLQCWNWFLSASVAAKKDLSPVFVDEWKFPLSPQAREQLGKMNWEEKSLSAERLVRKIRFPFNP
jgi:hypothetical protein